MRVTNEQWEDSLRSKRYPFDGFGEIVSDTGLVLPDDAFLDLNLMVEGDTATATLVSITVAAGAATATFQAGNKVSTVTLQPATVQAIGDAGFVRTGDAVPIVQGWPAGVHTFNVPIIPHLLVLSSPSWRSGFQLPDGTILTGDVYLVADVGLWFEQTLTGFTFNVTGDPFHGRTTPARGLKTLNGRAPVDGNVNLIGLSTTNFTPGFTVGGQAFRIDVTPGVGLTLTLVGA